MSIRPRHFLLLLTLAAGPAFAVDRLVSITAPAEVRPGGAAIVSVMAFTDATDGEQIGFLHSDYSLDGGKTWTNITYEAKAGRMLERAVTLTAGAAGTKIVVRMRVAFRDGKAGDVDFKGKPIEWDGTWGTWRSPPARFAIIYVR